MIKPLLCIPSPRDIPEFKDAIDTIPVDKYWAKYYHEPEAYDLLRDFFLEHKEYDYMVIVPDDLILTPRDFMILNGDAWWYEYPVVSGLCNLDWQRQNMYTPRKTWGTDYIDYFVTDKMLEDANKCLEYGDEPKYMERVKSCGFACTFIRRDVVEKIPFVDGHMNTFEHECERLDIPIFVDLRAKMLHLQYRKGRVEFENFYLNIKPRQLLFTKFTEKI